MNDKPLVKANDAAIERVRTALSMREAGYKASPSIEDVATLLWVYDRCPKQRMRKPMFRRLIVSEYLRSARYHERVVNLAQITSTYRDDFWGNVLVFTDGTKLIARDPLDENETPIPRRVTAVSTRTVTQTGETDG